MSHVYDGGTWKTIAGQPTDEVSSPLISRARWPDGRPGRPKQSLQPMAVGMLRALSISGARRPKPCRQLPQPDRTRRKQLRRQPTGRVSRMARSCAVRRLEYGPATRRKLLRRRGPTQR